MLTAVHTTMSAPAPYSMRVVTPNSIAMDKGTLLRAVGKVFDSGDWDDGLGVHSRVVPSNLVLSDVYRFMSCTLFQPAWTQSELPSAVSARKILRYTGIARNLYTTRRSSEALRSSAFGLLSRL